MSLPSVELIRQRIDSVNKDEIRICLKCAYLFTARISELISTASPKDTTTPRGPKGTDVRLDTFELGPLKEDVAIFKIKTAKRGGKERLIALPLNKQYEPWTEEVYEYYQSTGNDSVFPFTRQKAWQYSKNAFEGLTYPIERYFIIKKTLEVIKKHEIPSHIKPFRLHALRHLRTTELIEIYGFDGVDLSIYGGWTLRSTIGVGSAMERYAHLQWRKYFPKLLKER